MKSDGWDTSFNDEHQKTIFTSWLSWKKSLTNKFSPWVKTGFNSDSYTCSTISNQLHTQRKLNDPAQVTGLMTGASEGTRHIWNSQEIFILLQTHFSSSFIDTNNARIAEMENISRVGKISGYFSSLHYTCGTHSGLCYKCDHIFSKACKAILAPYHNCLWTKSF